MNFSVQSFQKTLPYNMDQFQVDACNILLADSSVLVCAPTSSGKTTIASFAQHLALSKRSKCFYTTPIKALSNQKFNDSIDEFGKDSVGLITGDKAVNPEAELLVMTTEVLRNMIYAKSDLLKGLEYVILDEVHYLQDASRGAVWEEVIVHLPKEIKLICLSATISNAHEVANWIKDVRGSCKAVQHNVRPVPLNKFFMFCSRSKPKKLVNIDSASSIGKVNKLLSKISHTVRPPRLYEIIDYLIEDEKLPAIFFIFSRQKCNEAAYSIWQEYKNLVTPAEQAQLQKLADDAIEKLTNDDLSALELDYWYDSFIHGVTPHHAGLIPQVRVAVENAILNGLIKIVFATETLSLGLNMPTKTVVITKFTKYNGFGHNKLSSSEVAQLSGRAGRRGIDTVGYLVVCWNNRILPEEIISIVRSNDFQLKSAFKPTYNMTINLLRLYSAEKIEKLLAQSFAQHGIKKDKDKLMIEMQKLKSAINVAKKVKKERLLRKKKKLEKRLDSFGLSLSNQFNNIVNLLEERDFLSFDDNKQVVIKEKGKLLTGLSTEADLLIAEVLNSKILDEISPLNLCAVISWFTYDSRGSITGEPPLAWPDDKLLDFYVQISKISVSILKDEREYKIVRSRSIDCGLTYSIYEWAEGNDLFDVLELQLMGGDFIRSVLNIIDVLEHIRVAYPKLYNTSKEAIRLLSRDIISDVLEN